MLHLNSRTSSNLLLTEREGPTGEYCPRSWQYGPSETRSVQKRPRLNIPQYGSSKMSITYLQGFHYTPSGLFQPTSHKFPICLTKFVKVGNEVVTNPCATISGKTNLLLHLYSGLILLMLKLACVFEKHLCIVLCL